MKINSARILYSNYLLSYGLMEESMTNIISLVGKGLSMYLVHN